MSSHSDLMPSKDKQQHTIEPPAALKWQHTALNGTTWVSFDTHTHAWYRLNCTLLSFIWTSPFVSRADSSSSSVQTVSEKSLADFAKYFYWWIATEYITHPVYFKHSDTVVKLSSTYIHCADCKPMCTHWTYIIWHLSETQMVNVFPSLCHLLYYVKDNTYNDNHEICSNWGCVHEYQMYIKYMN